MSGVNRDTVVELIDALRREAEAASASVSSTLSAATGGPAVSKVVAGFYNLLEDLGGRISRLHTALILASSRDPGNAATAAAAARATALLTYWTALASGFATYVRPATDAEREGVPVVGNPIAVAVVVVAVAGGVAVVAVSLTGAAWAVVHYAQASNLAAEIDLLEKNPAAAAALAAINDSAGPGSGGGPSAAMVAGGVVGVAAVVGAIALWLKNRG